MSAYRLGAAAAVAAATALLVACGQLPSGSRATRLQAGDNPSPSAPDPAAGQDIDSGADMVSAVGPAGTHDPISVKFRIESRPVVGTPVKIDVQLSAAQNVAINHIHGSFLAGSGLTLQSARSFDVPDLHAAWSRELTVVPQQTGVLSLTATILIEQDSGSQARTYSIPLIATDSSG